MRLFAIWACCAFAAAPIFAQTIAAPAGPQAPALPYSLEQGSPLDIEVTHYVHSFFAAPADPLPAYESLVGAFRSATLPARKAALGDLLSALSGNSAAPFARLISAGVDWYGLRIGAAQLRLAAGSNPRLKETMDQARQTLSTTVEQATPPPIEPIRLPTARLGNGWDGVLESLEPMSNGRESGQEPDSAAETNDDRAEPAAAVAAPTVPRDSEIRARREKIDGLQAELQAASMLGPLLAEKHSRRLAVELAKERKALEELEGRRQSVDTPPLAPAPPIRIAVYAVATPVPHEKAEAPIVDPTLGKARKALARFDTRLLPLLLVLIGTSGMSAIVAFTGHPYLGALLFTLFTACLCYLARGILATGKLFTDSLETFVRESDPEFVAIMEELDREFGANLSDDELHQRIALHVRVAAPEQEPLEEAAELEQAAKRKRVEP